MSFKNAEQISSARLIRICAKSSKSRQPIGCPLITPDPSQFWYLSHVERNRNPMQISKVYAVIAGIDYEGEVFETLRLFDCFSTADAYLKQLEAEYDYAKMDTREVCMESAIVAA